MVCSRPLNAERCQKLSPWWFLSPQLRCRNVPQVSREPPTSSPQMCNMLGLGDMNADQLASKLEETLPVIRSVSEQFKDPVSPGPGWR